MAEAWRNTPGSEELLEGRQVYEPELPENSSASPKPDNRAALNRSAEAVGRGVGTAVAGVRRLQSRMHLVGNREGAAGIKESVAETAAQSLSDLADTAEAYRSEIADYTRGRLSRLKSMATGKVDGLRDNARRRLMQVNTWKSQKPLQVIAVCAGAAFVAGVALRIWRSNSDYD